MAKSIQKIQQDLEALKVIVSEAGQELQDLYISYLNLLSKFSHQSIRVITSVVNSLAKT